MEPNALLLPNTGIQHINLGKIKLKGEWPQYTVENKVRRAPVTIEASDVTFQRPRVRSGGQGESVKEVASQLDEVIELAEADGGWLPLPLNSSGFHSSMLWIGRADKDDEFEAVLAVDTTISQEADSGSLEHSNVPSQIMLAAAPGAAFWLGLEPYVERHYVRRRKLEPDSELLRGEIQAHLAGFFSVLVASGCIPEVEISNPVQRPVNVSLVIDLGNSRTCCVLREMDALDGRPLFHALRLVNPKRPLESSEEPFETRMVFISPWNGVYGAEASTFHDLSMVRMGTFASDILGGMSSDIGTRGMSGPKRYLWDDEQRQSPWQVADEIGKNSRSPIQGLLLTAMDPAVDPFNKSAQAIPDPANPCYPRKAGLIFALVEILEQAFRQANSVEFRGAGVQQDGYLRRRILRNIVLMHPAGMHSEEVARLLTGAKRAARIWAEFRTDSAAFRRGEDVPIESLAADTEAREPWTVVPCPNVLRVCDEGLSIQLCHLFGTVEHRFQGQTELMVKLLGRPREGRPSLRIASIDIGGGTTDVAIADYFPNLSTHVPQFELKRRFHEGIARGGDDICRELLESRVFPQLAAAHQISAADWDKAFSSRKGDKSPAWAMARRRLVPLFWYPLLRGCLARLERNEGVDSPVRELLVDMATARIQELNDKLKSVAGRAASDKLDVSSTTLRIDPADLLTVTRRTLGPVLSQFCDVIGQFAPDLLIVGGRPASLPQVRQLLEEQLPVTPAQMVFLHEQKFGDWFPFAPDGMVGDSKTCSVVGAALMFIARYSGQDMNARLVLRGDEHEQDAASNVLGVLNERRLELEQPTLFTGEELVSRPTPCNTGKLLVGCRRIDDPRATSKPVYKIELDAKLTELLQASDIENNMNFDIQLARKNPTSDTLTKIESMKGVVKVWIDGKVREFKDKPIILGLRLQTMLENEYWLDTGTFGEFRESESA